MNLADVVAGVPNVELWLQVVADALLLVIAWAILTGRRLH